MYRLYYQASLHRCNKRDATRLYASSSKVGTGVSASPLLSLSHGGWLRSLNDIGKRVMIRVAFVLFVDAGRDLYDDR